MKPARPIWMMAALPALLLAVASLVFADDFRREQDLSAKENKPAPALQATGWMNTPDDKPLKLEDLKGKVVVIDFWGTW